MDQDFRKNIQRLHAAVESMPGGALLIAPEGRIVLANSEAESLFGYAGGELADTPLEKVIPRRYWEKGDNAGVPAFSAGESTGIRKDGTEVAFEMRIGPAAEGGCFLVSVLDSSSSKHTEQLFRTAIESAPSGMIIINQAGSIVLVNREAERIFGYGREELIGHSVEILIPERFRAKHPGYRKEYGVHPSSRLMGGGRHLHGLRKDGAEVPLEIGLNPIRTGQGLYILSVIVDITERIEAEEALRKTAEELAISNADLEQFAYIASHDLQEPLRMVIGFLQLLRHRKEAQLDEKAKSYIEYAENGAIRMSHLIHDLLEYSRVQHKRREFEHTDLNQVLEFAMTNLQTSIQESGAVINHDELPAVDGDPTQLTQLFQNLLGNAIKFHRKGKYPDIYVSCRRDGRHWVTSIRDNGIGINSGYVDRIFKVFQRLHSQKEYPGTGIGLAICKKIVEQHGGKIWVESKPGEGSTFYFSLPCQSEL